MGKKKGGPCRTALPSGQVIAQLAAASRVAQLPQRLGFDLADALAGHVEVAADLLQRMVLPIQEAEA